MSSKSIQITQNDTTIAGKCVSATTTPSTPPEFDGDWGDSDCNGSITDIPSPSGAEFEGDWGDFDFFNETDTELEPEFGGDWGDLDFNGNESGPE